jgi:septal ring factor EnvC (AmiA/AmiB activator)
MLETSIDMKLHRAKRRLALVSANYTKQSQHLRERTLEKLKVVAQDLAEVQQQLPVIENEVAKLKRQLDDMLSQLSALNPAGYTRNQL